MSGLNKVMLIGRMGQDPEIRYTQQGNAVVNFSLATSEKWTDKNTGQQQEKTEWHRCVCFGKPAETINQYCSKGSQLYVEGQLQTRQWEKDGQNHYTTEIVVRNFQFLGGNRQQNGQGQGQHSNQSGYQQGGQGQQNHQRQGGYQHNPSEYSPRAQPREQYRQPQGGQQGNPGGPDPIPDDDIPF